MQNEFRYSFRDFDSIEEWGEAKGFPNYCSPTNVTTWSSALRNLIDSLRDKIISARNMLADTAEFRAYYEEALNNLLNEGEMRPNSNFVRRLYKEAEEDDLIRSSVYKNNKNHMIKIITDEDGIDWYACAVYTGEIIWVLEALVDTIKNINKDVCQKRAKSLTFEDLLNHKEIVLPLIEIFYEEREDSTEEEVDLENVEEQVQDIDNEIQKLEMSKDIIKIMASISKLSTELLNVYGNLNDLMEKYNIPTLDDILTGRKSE